MPDQWGLPHPPCPQIQLRRPTPDQTTQKQRLSVAIEATSHSARLLCIGKPGMRTTFRRVDLGTGSASAAQEISMIANAPPCASNAICNHLTETLGEAADMSKHPKTHAPSGLHLRRLAIQPFGIRTPWSGCLCRLAHRPTARHRATPPLVRRGPTTLERTVRSTPLAFEPEGWCSLRSVTPRLEWQPRLGHHPNRKSVARPWPHIHTRLRLLPPREHLCEPKRTRESRGPQAMPRNRQSQALHRQGRNARAHGKSHGQLADRVSIPQIPRAAGGSREPPAGRRSHQCIARAIHGSKASGGSREPKAERASHRRVAPWIPRVTGGTHEPPPSPAGRTSHR